LLNSSGRLFLFAAYPTFNSPHRFFSTSLLVLVHRLDSSYLARGGKLFWIGGLLVILRGGIGGFGGLPPGGLFAGIFGGI